MTADAELRREVRVSTRRTYLLFTISSCCVVYLLMGSIPLKLD